MGTKKSAKVTGGRPTKRAASSKQRASRQPAPRSKSETAGLLQTRAYTRRQALLAVSGIVRRQRRPTTGAVASAAAPKTAKGRKGRRAMTILLDPLAKTLLDEIALEHGMTMQELGLEAVNLLLEAYDRKPVA